MEPVGRGHFPFKHVRPEDRVLGRLLEEKARLNGGRIFLNYRGERSLSYAQMDEMANRTANGFRSLDVSYQDTVAVIAPGSPEFLFVWFGLAKLGAVMVPVNVHYRGELLRHVLSNCGAQVVVVHQSLVDRVFDVAGTLPHALTVVVLGADGALLGASDSTKVLSASALFEQPPAPIDVPVRHSDLLEIIYTSGTTGPSKGVMLTHNQAYAFADIVAQAMEMTREDVYYTCLPFFHVNAQLTTLGTLIYDGQTALYDRFSASNFWSEIRASGATAFSLFGAMSYFLYKQPPSHDDSSHHVRACWVFPAPYDVQPQFERRFGLKILTAYASTEANFPAIIGLHDAPRPPAAGLVHPAFELQICDEDDLPVPNGTVGEILVRPREPFTTMLGYYRMPEQTAQAFRNLWYHTSDAGYMDADGYVYFVDRIKDAIRRRGENISSFDVERSSTPIPPCWESAALAVKSEVSEDEVKVVVVLHPDQQLSPAELICWCEPRMAYFMVPRYVEFVAELPKTPNGKVEKHKLRQAGVTPGTWDREAAGYKLKR